MLRKDCVEGLSVEPVKPLEIGEEVIYEPPKHEIHQKRWCTRIGEKAKVLSISGIQIQLAFSDGDGWTAVKNIKRIPQLRFEKRQVVKYIGKDETYVGLWIVEAVIYGQNANQNRLMVRRRFKQAQHSIPESMFEIAKWGKRQLAVQGSFLPHTNFNQPPYKGSTGNAKVFWYPGDDNKFSERATNRYTATVGWIESIYKEYGEAGVEDGEAGVRFKDGGYLRIKLKDLVMCSEDTKYTEFTTDGPILAINEDSSTDKKIPELKAPVTKVEKLLQDVEELKEEKGSIERNIDKHLKDLYLDLPGLDGIFNFEGGGTCPKLAINGKGTVALKGAKELRDWLIDHLSAGEK